MRVMFKRRYTLFTKLETILASYSERPRCRAASSSSWKSSATSISSPDASIAFSPASWFSLRTESSGGEEGATAGRPDGDASDVADVSSALPACVSGRGIARHHIGKLGLEEKPSWRRAKSLDNFRHRVPQVHDGVFLDDPSRDRLDMADLKSFMTAEEDQTCSGRYNDVKLNRGQVRAYAGNHLTFEDEPAPDARTTITPEEILKMLGKTFPGEREADVMAVLKRSIAFVFGKNALYLRLPSQRSDGIVHRIVAEDVHLDVLAPHDKYLLSEYKTGNIKIKGSDFEDSIAREQNMIHNSFMNMSEMGPKEYIDHCAKKVQQHICPTPTPARRVRHLPSSSSSPEDSAIPPTVPFTVQLATHDQPRKRLLNSSVFRYPSPTRRTRGKTMPPASIMTMRAGVLPTPGQPIIITPCKTSRGYRSGNRNSDRKPFKLYVCKG